MLVTFLLSWLLAAEPACRSGCASDRAHAITQHAPPAACDDGIPTVPPGASPEILSFEAAWCAPCQEMKSILAQLTRSGVRVRYIDVDREPELARKHQIRSIPTFVNVTDGREVRRVVGVCSERTLTDLAGAAASARAASASTTDLAPGAAHAEMLVRARYELEAKKAEALDAFLEGFAAEKVEVQRAGGDVVITASPEVQQALGRFMTVVQDSTSKASACGPDCPAKWAGGGTRACEDGVASGAAHLRTSDCPVGPPAWMRHPRLMFGIGVNSEAGAMGGIVFDEPALQRFARWRSSAHAAECETAACERRCGDACTNACGGECTTSCEDGVPRGAAVPDAPEVPLVPPVWMSTAALPPKVTLGRAIDADPGVCSAVVLDELTPALMRLTRYRVLEGAGPFYTMVLTADRGLIADVREFVETKTREYAEQGGKRLLFGVGSAEPMTSANAAEPDAESEKRPTFSFGFGEITR